MKSVNKTQVLKTLYILFWAFLVVAFGTANSWRISIYTLGKLTGVAAISLICLQFVLSSRMGILEKGVGLGKLMSWHKLIGKTATLFMVIHPIALVIFALSLGLKLDEYIQDYTLYHYFGIASFAIAIVVIATSIYTSKFKLNYENWKWVHRLVYLMLVLNFFHALNLGSDIAAHNAVYYWWIFVYSLAILGIVHRHLYLPFIFKNSIFEVIDTKIEADNVRSILLKPLGRKMIFRAGQFVFTRFYSSSLSQEEHPFSISSSPASPIMEMTIKAEGDFTSSLSQLRRGDKLRLQGPYGIFTPRLNKSVFMIAGGIGITPIMSMLRYFEEAKNISKVKLLYSCKAKKDMSFYKELRMLEKNGWFEAKYFLSQEKRHGFLHGRVDISVLTREVELWRDAIFFVVGPEPMTESVKLGLASLGISNDQIVTELFKLK